MSILLTKHINLIETLYKFGKRIAEITLKLVQNEKSRYNYYLIYSNTKKSDN